MNRTMGVVAAGLLVLALDTAAGAQEAEPYPRCIVPVSGIQSRGFKVDGRCRPLAPGEAWVDDPCYRGPIPIYDEAGISVSHADAFGCAWGPPSPTEPQRCELKPDRRMGYVLGGRCVPLFEGRWWPTKCTDRPILVAAADGTLEPGAIAEPYLCTGPKSEPESPPMPSPRSSLAPPDDVHAANLMRPAPVPAADPPRALPRTS